MAYKSKGFTLIELLVVISIIALLIGLLLPALASAKSSANNIVCQTNVRSLMIAEVAYTNDFQGGFSIGEPWEIRSWAPGGNPTLEPDENSTATDYDHMNFAQGTLYEYMGKESAAYKCPVGSEELQSASGGLLQRSYSKNAYVSDAPSYNLNRFPMRSQLRKKISAVLQPSGMFVFGEENSNKDNLGELTDEQKILELGSTYNDSWVIVKHPKQSAPVWDDSIGTYHGSDPVLGFTNQSFVDGHVASNNPIYAFYKHNGNDTYNVQRIAFDNIPTDPSGPTGKTTGSTPR